MISKVPNLELSLTFMKIESAAFTEIKDSIQFICLLL